jgi:hypothetical protein
MLVANLNIYVNKFSKSYHEPYIIPEWAKITYKEIYEANKDNVLQKDSTINLSSLSTLPSYKLKNYIEENNLNIQTARKYDKVDTIILDNDLIREGYINEKNENIYFIPKEFIFEHFDKYIDHEKVGTGGWNDFTYLGGCPIDAYVIGEKELNEYLLTFPHLILIKDKIEPIYGHVLYKVHGNKKIIDNIELFKQLGDIVYGNDLRVVFDSNISNEINKDMSFDIDMFENMFNMLNSNDEGNWQIAKEVLANCDYESSEPYLIYLFNFFYELRRTSSNKNYSYLRSKLKPFRVGHFGKQDEHIFNYIIPKLMENHPHYAQEFMDCFRIHMNSLCKKNVILDIKTK